MTKSADIGSLSFELLIDDTKFNDSITKASDAARDLNVTLSDLLDLRKKYRAEAQSSAKAERDVTNALRQQKTQMRDSKNAIRTTTNEIKKYNAEKRKMTVLGGGNAGISLGQQQGILNNLTSLAAKYVSIWGATKLVQSIVRVTAEFELQRTALRSMLGDIQAADALYNKIWDLAVKSPFNAKELVTYTKQLAAYSIPLDQIYDTTKMLADVSAGLGVGMDRLVLAYGQIRSASFLRGQEVRQLTEAGIPILEELRKQFVELGEEAITAGDVFDKISKRLVPFEMVEKVFKNMTSEGGKFYEMQAVQAETLKGKLMILKDAYDKMFNAIGSKNNSSLKGAVDWVTNLARHYDKTTGALKVLIATYGSYKVALMSLRTIYNATHIIKMITYYHSLAVRMRALGKEANLLSIAFTKASSAQVLKAISGIAGAIALVTSAIIVAVKNAHELENELKSLSTNKFNEAQTLAKGFEELAQRIKDANEGSQERRDAISEMNRKYGEYLPNLLNEKNALDEIAKSEKEVTSAIYGRMQAYAKEEGMRKIEEKYGNAMSDDTQKLIEVLTDKGATKTMATEFVQNYRSALESAYKDGAVLTTMPMEQFEESMKSYFGSKSNIVKAMYEFSGYFSTIVSQYQKDFLDMAEANERFNRTLESRFGVYNYKFADEREAIQGIIDEYGKLENAIRATANQTEEETNARLLQNRKDKLNDLIVAYQKLNEQYDELGKKGIFNPQIEKLTRELAALDEKDLTWLQKIINPLVDDTNSDLKPVDTGQYADYVDELRKHYKATMSTYEDLEKTYNKLVSDKQQGLITDEQILEKAQSLYESEKKRKDVIEAIAKALGITLEESKTKDTGKNERQKEIETRISTLKDLLKWYDKFKDLGVDENEIHRIFASIFPQEEDVIQANDYRNALLELATALEVYDKKAAQALRDDVGGNVMDTYYDRFKAAKDAGEKLKTILNKLTENTLLEGKGVKYDVSKIVYEYNKALQAIADGKKEAMDAYFNATKSGYTDVNSEDFFADLTKWEDVESHNALAKATDAMDNLADAFVKDWAKIKGIKFSSWSDLAVEDLIKLKAELGKVMSNGSILDGIKEELPAEIKAMLANYPQLWETFGQSVASAIDSHINENVVKAAMESGEKLQKYLRDLTEDTLLEGKGVEFDVSKIVFNYNKALKSIEEKRKEGIADFFAATASGNTDVSAEEFFSELNAWEDIQMHNAMAKAIDSMDGLAEAFLKDWADIKGINLQDWGDLSINALKKLSKELDNILNEDGTLNIDDSSLMKKLEAALATDYPELWKTLQEAVTKKVNAKKGKVGQFIDDKSIKLYKQAADAILNLNNALYEYAEAAGKTKLSKTSKALAEISDVARDTIAGFQSGGWVGGAISLISSISVKALEAATEVENLKSAIASAQMAAKEYYWTQKLNSGDTIFGNNIFADINNAASVGKEILAEYWAMLDKAAKGYGKLESVTIRIHDSLLFSRWDKYKTIKDVIEGLNFDFYDENGMINVEGLQKVLDTYKYELTKADKEWIEKAIAYTNKFKEALEQTKDVMSDLLGNVADSAIDNIIDGWINAGNAALDYSDILSDVAKSYAQMVIKNQLMSKIFDDKFVEEITQATMNGRASVAMARLENKMAEIAKLEPDITAVLSSLNQWLKTSDSSSIGSSIQGVTEDTANLLGAYINGMRADLSAQRIVIEGIGVDMKSLVAHIPTLDDYLNQIAANTYNTAQSTNSILSSLESMMTNASGETALRVFM